MIKTLSLNATICLKLSLAQVKLLNPRICKNANVWRGRGGGGGGLGGWGGGRNRRSTGAHRSASYQDDSQTTVRIALIMVLGSHYFKNV